MADQITDADRNRMGRAGVVPLAPAEGLALFDAALTVDRPVIVPVRLDVRRTARHGPRRHAARRLRGLVGDTGAAAGETAAARTPPWPAASPGYRRPTRRRSCWTWSRHQAAAVLGHATAAPLEPTTAFKDIGFDSLTAVELRNRLKAATGLRLQPTLVFDHPDPAAIARLLHEDLVPDRTAEAPPVLDELDRLEAQLAALAPQDAVRDNVTARLKALLWKWTGHPQDAGRTPPTPATAPTATSTGSTPPPTTRCSTSSTNELGVSLTHLDALLPRT